MMGREAGELESWRRYYATRSLSQPTIFEGSEAKNQRRTIDSYTRIETMSAARLSYSALVHRQQEERRIVVVEAAVVHPRNHHRYHPHAERIDQQTTATIRLAYLL